MQGCEAGYNLSCTRRLEGRQQQPLGLVLVPGDKAIASLASFHSKGTLRHTGGQNYTTQISFLKSYQKTNPS